MLAGTTRPLGGREVARLAGVSQNGAWRALRRLVDQGVVIEQPAGGRTILHTLNREHLAAGPIIITLTRLRSILIERLQGAPRRLGGSADPCVDLRISGARRRRYRERHRHPRHPTERGGRGGRALAVADRLNRRRRSILGPGITRVSRNSPSAELPRLYVANAHLSSRTLPPTGSPSSATGAVEPLPEAAISPRAQDRGRTQVCGSREAQAKLRRAE